ncbi:MAG: response regulator [Blastochloris viridis]|uniref:Response regulator n=1 Tax=Blastochloris viridis TaxID=1079 RepID=A0A6N4RCB1_BLAVI|nr:MAG: response regulator [Blastochloris viridis]
MVHAQILIIDENARARALLAKQLTDLAYDVHTADSLTDALTKLKAANAEDKPYECICLGPMERTSGLGRKVLRVIRQQKGYGKTIVIGASHDESFWAPMKATRNFLTVPYTDFKDSEEPKWDTHTLKSYLPTPKVMATI